MPPDPLALTKLPPHTRLSAPEFDPAFAREYERALDALDADGVAYLLGGALALNAHTGIWRDTKDLDVFCRPADKGRVLAALGRAGFEPQVVYEEWLGKAWRGEVFVDVIWRNANSLFPVTDDWLRRATTARVLGRDARVLPVEALILSKMMVGGRYRFDGADILHAIHAAHDRIDWARLAEDAGEHAGLLLAYLHAYRWGYPAWKDRVPDDVLEHLARQARTVESGYGPFRARLLDLQTFAVDVEGWGLPDPHAVALERALAGEG